MTIEQQQLLFVEQPELINAIQQFLPVNEMFESRLICKQWKHAIDIDGTIWKRQLDNLKTNVLPRSYLVQSYTFSSKNRLLENHILSKSNKIQDILMKQGVSRLELYSNLNNNTRLKEKYEIDLSQQTMDKWIIAANVQHGSEYYKFRAIVQQLEALKKRIPTPEVAEYYLNIVYNKFNNLVATQNYITLAGVMFHFSAILTTKYLISSLLVKILITMHLLCYLVSTVLFLTQYVLLYLSHTMTKREKIARIIFIAPIVIHQCLLLYYYQVWMNDNNKAASQLLQLNGILLLFFVNANKTCTRLSEFDYSGMYDSTDIYTIWFIKLDRIITIPFAVLLCGFQIMELLLNILIRKKYQ
jgi:hypothetical protein